MVNKIAYNTVDINIMHIKVYIILYIAKYVLNL